MPVRDLLALEPDATARFEALQLGYVDSRGTLELRGAIASLYDHHDPDAVLVHGGAQEPIFTFMNTVLAPGDHVVVQSPAYQSQYSIPEAIGAEVTRWSSDLSREGAPDPHELERLIRHTTRVIVVTTPNNPTGFPFDNALMEAVIAIARRHGCWLFGDEVYRGTEREAEAIPAVCDAYERGVSLGALSKTYGLAGLRVGWIATRDRALLDRIATYKDYLTICNSAPASFLGALALRHRDALIERVHRIITANLERLDEFFSRRRELFEWQRPRAGTTGFPRFLGGSSEAFCARLAEHAGVLLLPSTIYGAGDEHVRVGYGRINLPEALAALEAFIDCGGAPET